MVNRITDGISLAIHNKFGDGYEIYTESIEQGLEEPCFFISALNPSKNRFLGEKFKRNTFFMIQYFPSTSDVNYECQNIAEKLFDCLEVIGVAEDKIRGTELEYEVVDEVLNFSVAYNLFEVKIVPEEDEMENLKLKKEVK